jgi:hypothetical protein
VGGFFPTLDPDPAGEPSVRVSHLQLLEQATFDPIDARLDVIGN